MPVCLTNQSLSESHTRKAEMDALVLISSLELYNQL